jgi:secondary thiamine-phosphate synthase enzyme
MIITYEINLKTKGNGDIIDITAGVQERITNSGVNNGAVVIFVTGSTAGITTIEFEPGLVADLQESWEKLIPRNKQYQHEARWGDGNGYAHIRASLQGASLSVPFSNKKLVLGTWQQIVLVDFDNRPRSRNIVVQIMGE